MVENNINYIRYIKNPTEKVQLYVINEEPDFIASIENPTELVQLTVVQKHAFYFSLIKNPTERVINFYFDKLNDIDFVKNEIKKLEQDALKN
jgi:hypothetical protein